MRNDVFISYRRGPTSGHAGRLYDRLADAFGREHVFMDVDTIPPGMDFVRHIEQAITDCDAMLVVIGPDWVEARKEDGTRRLEDPDDFVRLEVAGALERGLRVIPVLVQGAQPPLAGGLPEDLKPLARHNAFPLNDLRWGDDVQHLVNSLAYREKRRRPRRVWLGAVAVTLIGALAAVALLGSGGEEPETVSTTAPKRLPRTIEVGGEPTGVAYGDGAIWVTNAGDGTLTKVDTRSGKVSGAPLALGASPTFVAADDKAVWVTTAGGERVRGNLQRIDPRTNQPVGSPLRTGRLPAGVAIGGGSVWVANAADGTVTRVDPATGRRETIRVGGVPVSIAYGAGRLWVPDSAGQRLRTIDAATGRLDRRPIRVGREPFGVAVGEGMVWVVNTADGTVSRIRPDGTVAGETRVGGEPGDVAVGGGSVWVSNEGKATLTRLDPRSGRVLDRATAVGKSPAGLVVAADAVWVANTGDGTLSRIPLTGAR
jgi:DNA-binding beta-propeller fold protein YncE